MVTRAIVFLALALSTSPAIAGSVYTPPAAASDWPLEHRDADRRDVHRQHPNQERRERRAAKLDVPLVDLPPLRCA